MLVCIVFYLRKETPLLHLMSLVSLSDIFLNLFFCSVCLSKQKIPGVFPSNMCEAERVAAGPYIFPSDSRELERERAK